MEEFINLNEDNIDKEHICCIIRSKDNDAILAKKKWLKDRIKEGHVFRKLNVKGTVFIEYAPLDKAWVPIQGNNYLYIYCLWVNGEYKHKGYGKALMEYAINDAKKHNKSGICMLGSVKQKNWLSNQEFAKKYRFKVVDETNNGYQLLALSFDGSYPKFMENAKRETIQNKELTIYYDMQCPFITQKIRNVKDYCDLNKIPLILNEVKSLKAAKGLPCVFNNYALFYNEKFITVNILDTTNIKELML